MNDRLGKKSRETTKGGRSSKGADTRRKILAYAMRIAAREGLAGLTIGRLARDLRMSKSGLFAHFRSKRLLEMATINEARKVFTTQVLSPATSANEGIERLWVLCDSWLAHIERKVFPGGYFFTGAFFECAERSGPLEEEISRMAREWRETLSNAVRKAQEHKEINSFADARRITFDLNGILIATYWAYLVEKDRKVFSEARIALIARLKALATSQVPVIAFESEKAWKEYLKEKRAPKPASILPRLEQGMKQSSSLSPSTPPPRKPNPQKSKSFFSGLKRAVRRRI